MRTSTFRNSSRSHYNIAENESGQAMNKKNFMYVLKVKKVRTGTETFSHIGPKIWYSLPESIKRVGYIVLL